MRMRTPWVVLVLASTLAGCGAVMRGRQDPEVITRAQIEDGRFQTAAEVVAALRSNWLNVKKTSFRTAEQVQVYHDLVLVGGPSELAAINARTIEYIRHYNGVEATTRFGVGHSQGAIVVSSTSP